MILSAVFGHNPSLDFFDVVRACISGLAISLEVEFIAVGLERSVPKPWPAMGRSPVGSGL